VGWLVVWRMGRSVGERIGRMIGWLVASFQGCLAESLVVWTTTTTTMMVTTKLAGGHAAPLTQPRILPRLASVRSKRSALVAGDPAHAHTQQATYVSTSLHKQDSCQCDTWSANQRSATTTKNLDSCTTPYTRRSHPGWLQTWP
jgi:hypothetical protein